jgi:glutaredoxin 3
MTSRKTSVVLLFFQVLCIDVIASWVVLVNGFQPKHFKHSTSTSDAISRRSTTTSSTCRKGRFGTAKYTVSALPMMNFLNEGKKALVKSLAGDYDTNKIRSIIDESIKSESVVMFSFSTCPYCIKAKSILNENKIDFKAIELDQDAINGKAIRAELGEMIGRTSVPAIWIEQQYIGGCNDGGPNNGGLVQYQQQGKLNALKK